MPIVTSPGVTVEFLQFEMACFPELLDVWRHGKWYDFLNPVFHSSSEHSGAKNSIHSYGPADKIDKLRTYLKISTLPPKRPIFGPNIFKFWCHIIIIDTLPECFRANENTEAKDAYHKKSMGLYSIFS